MTINMIVDECDKYELPDITDTFRLNFSTADSCVRSSIVSGREVNVFFFLPLSTYTLQILGLGEGMCGGPNLLIPAGSTIVQYTF
jgi:hypothetical protein